MKDEVRTADVVVDDVRRLIEVLRVTCPPTWPAAVPATERARTAAAGRRATMARTDRARVRMPPPPG